MPLRMNSEYDSGLRLATDSEAACHVATPPEECIEARLSCSVVESWGGSVDPMHRDTNVAAQNLKGTPAFATCICK